jgi:hypothetical protein
MTGRIFRHQQANTNRPKVADLAPFYPIPSLFSDYLSITYKFFYDAIQTVVFYGFSSTANRPA